MALTDVEIEHILVALVAILVAAHGCGHLFARFRQPPVIGEIIGGLLLGPTLFGRLFPAEQAALFPREGPTPIVLGAIYQLGLLLLMFAAGAEIRSVFHRGERRTAVAITASGTVLPFLAGLLFLQLVDARRFYGDAGNSTAFLLVFAIAIAVTSIPVISRIMFDLGIIGTSFARVVLTAAVIEDVVLYVVLAIALGLVRVEQGGEVGVAGLLGFGGDSSLGIAYHVVVTIAFFAFFLRLGPRLLRGALRFRYNFLNFASPIAFELAFVFAVTAICIVLGVSGFLGAFVAGIVTSNASDDPGRDRTAIKNFSFAFFIPVYFGIVGLRLDLVHGFDPAFFLLFFAFACAAKALSVYGGARIAGESRFAATNLAVAMNARGGPGIVLATVAFDAGIVDEGFYATLVLLVVITSLAAGTWLEWAIRTGRPLREPAADPVPIVTPEPREPLPAP
jgi:Kef-type K+ transport system membrane component KefB